MGEQHVPLYTSAYAGYDVRTRIRSLTYGDDVGQSGWLTADELERFARSLELDSGSRLLDVGCGAGGPALRLASTTGATVVGVDVLDEAVATAQQLAASHGLGDRVTFVRADADRRLPFDDGSFDAILSVDAMCHLPDRLAVLREWRRLAAPGARILFTGPDGGHRARDRGGDQVAEPDRRLRLLRARCERGEHRGRRLWPDRLRRPDREHGHSRQPLARRARVVPRGARRGRRQATFDGVQQFLQTS